MPPSPGMTVYCRASSIRPSCSRYLSEYLEENRDRYYQHLRGIGTDGGWTGWVEFFLDAVEQQALANTRRVKGILELYDEMKIAVSEITRSQHSPAILDAIFDRPVFRMADFTKRSKVSVPTAKSVLRKLKEAGILVTVHEARGSSPAVLAFRELVNQAEGRKIL